MWNLERIPKAEHREVIALFQRREYAELVDLLNRYRVAGARLKKCCGVDERIEYVLGRAIRSGELSDYENKKI